MKILDKFLFVSICFGLFCACSEKGDIDSFTSYETVNLKSSTIKYVAPSGDLTGVSDANNNHIARNAVHIQ